MARNGLLNTLGKVQLGLVHGLLVLACLLTVTIFVVIIFDVTLRTIGVQAPPWPGVIAEMSLIYIAMSAAPYLVRTAGHVFVEILTSQVPEWARYALEKFVYVFCIAICVLFAAVAFDISLDAWLRGDEDFRAIDVPLWVATAPLTPGFALMAIEFARYLAGFDSMYRKKRSGEREDV